MVSRFLESNQHSAAKQLSELSQTRAGRSPSFSRWQELKDIILSVSEHPHITFEIAKTVQAKDFGVLGYLFQSSANLFHGLATIERYQKLLVAGVYFRVEKRSATTSAIVMRYLDDSQDRHLDEFLCRIFLALMNKTVDGFVIRPNQLCVRQTLSAMQYSYYEVEFGCPVKTGHQQLELIFNTHDLMLASSLADAGLFQILESQAQILTKQQPETDEFISLLRDGIIQSIHDGKPNVEYVATYMGTSARTLHRKLEQRNLKFRYLLRDVRKKLSEHYLAQEHLTIVEVAFLLGYSEQSTFTRAFTSWHGTTPAQFRKNMSPNKILV